MRSVRLGGAGADQSGGMFPKKCGWGCMRCSRECARAGGFHQPHHLRFEVDHIVALTDDGEDQVFNLQLLCPYCNRTKATKGPQGFRMKMAELRAHNVATGMMVDGRSAELTGKRLARYHRELSP